jgi:hypothetical protein
MTTPGSIPATWLAKPTTIRIEGQVISVIPCANRFRVEVLVGADQVVERVKPDAD